MQEVKREVLVSKASELLKNGTVDRVLGWKAGEFDYDITPAVFHTGEELEQDFVWNDFCGANFSKYLVSETGKSENKILVFLKPCDTYSFNQLLTEHRFDREKVYAVGVGCNGMLDVAKLRSSAEGILRVNTEDPDKVAVETLYDGTVTLDRAELLPDRCVNCKSRKHVAYDELLGSDGEVLDCHRFDEVEQIERMTPDERYAFWQGELSRCIRCNACRDVCPACTCEKCVFDNPQSGVENKAPATSFEEQMFHIIRAFHVAGRCTDCGECSRVCPQHIPLHLLNRKFIKDIDNFYGDYQAGAEVGSRAPIVNYRTDDLEPGEAVERGGEHA
ncbi:4Fe-4S dicluster domain-containing protein [Ruminococcus champanellensis]|uniref:4Fe-4S dicluster domain-containing protein n=1 Tax=Ruminococcus champanellensis TaxID=1161942 RepID=UPI0023F41D2D|nr:4Fe-4S dicluster domain-containing protein [Ruminococcus champanellensis]MED9890751.1 4Fe-4S dicluster domain-containing protein [Ruminococcus champanellensis]